MEHDARRRLGGLRPFDRRARQPPARQARRRRRAGRRFIKTVRGTGYTLHRRRRCLRARERVRAAPLHLREAARHHGGDGAVPAADGRGVLRATSSTRASARPSIAVLEALRRRRSPRESPGPARRRGRSRNGSASTIRYEGPAAAGRPTGDVPRTGHVGRLAACLSPASEPQPHRGAPRDGGAYLFAWEFGRSINGRPRPARRAAARRSWLASCSSRPTRCCGGRCVPCGCSTTASRASARGTSTSSCRASRATSSARSPTPSTRWPGASRR